MPLPPTEEDSAMTITAKSQLDPEQGAALNPVSSYYNMNGPIADVIADIDDEVRIRGRDGRFVSDGDIPVIDRVAESISRAAKSVQQTAKTSATRAQQGARSTAQAAREHPAMTAAVLGGIATAAIAGVRLYKARQAPAQNFVEPATPKRRVTASKPASKRKH
jgi:hypothetical protein